MRVVSGKNLVRLTAPVTLLMHTFVVLRRQGLRILVRCVEIFHSEITYVITMPQPNSQNVSDTFLLRKPSEV